MATIVRAVVTLPSVDAVDRDSAQNVLHWTTTDDPTPDDLDDIGNEIVSFFNLEVLDDDGDAISDSSMSRYISAMVSRGEDDCSIDFYDCTGLTAGGGGAVGDPIGLRSFTMGAFMTGSLPLPSELSAALTIRATPAEVIPIRRRTGRVYLGPINTAALGTRTISAVDYPALSTEFRDHAARACSRMATGGTLVQWAIYSRAADQAYTVAEGYVDNEIDIQRRRGYTPSLRTRWRLDEVFPSAP